MSAADQAARNAALVVTSVPNNTQLDGYLSDLNRSIVPQVAVLTPAGRSLGTADDLRTGSRRTPCAHRGRAARHPRRGRCRAAAGGRRARYDGRPGERHRGRPAARRDAGMARDHRARARADRPRLGDRPPARTADQRAAARRGPDRPPAPRGRPVGARGGRRHARDRRARPRPQRPRRAHRRAPGRRARGGRRPLPPPAHTRDRPAARRRGGRRRRASRAACRTTSPCSS